MNIWHIISDASGVIYFTAWSISFYPQLILNYRRKTSLGLSPDFALVNPIGFFCQALWSWGAYFSPTARRQYGKRHDGHMPQVSVADLAFSLHALILALATFIQSAWYFYRAHEARKNPQPMLPFGERDSLLGRDDDIASAPTTISTHLRGGLTFLAVATLWQVSSLALGRTEFLDFLYFASTVKLIITFLKYLPQVYLNYQIKSVRGFAINTIFCDLVGGVLSLVQLVVSAVFIDGAASGIWANPAKLGLSILTLLFDFVFIFQRYVLYPVAIDQT